MTDRYPEPLPVDARLDVLERVVAQQRATKPRMSAATPFPAALALALKAARMSQSELARRVGCGRNLINAYLRGRNVPPREMLAKINDALGADLCVARAITVRQVAAAMGMCEETMRRALALNIYPEIGRAIPSPSGKRRCYRFYPQEVKRLCGID
jgi:DNA-binding phage protein